MIAGGAEIAQVHIPTAEAVAAIFLFAVASAPVAIGWIALPAPENQMAALATAFLDSLPPPLRAKATLPCAEFYCRRDFTQAATTSTLPRAAGRHSALCSVG